MRILKELQYILSHFSEEVSVVIGVVLFLLLMLLVDKAYSQSCDQKTYDQIYRAITIESELAHTHATVTEEDSKATLLRLCHGQLPTKGLIKDQFIRSFGYVQDNKK